MISARQLWLLAAILMLVPLALFSQTAQGESAFSIARSSSDGVTVHFTLPDWKLEQVQNLQKVSIADANYIFIDEKETLPVFSTMIAIPNSGGARLNLLGSQDQSRNQVTLDFDGELTAERNAGRYNAALYPADQALISTPQVLRDFRVVSVNIYPFQYDQQSKQLIVRQNMDIRIDFNNAPSVNEIAAPTGYSSAFEKIYKGLILNYDQALDRDVSYTSPKMLVIYGNYSDVNYTNKVNEYVAWKKQKGFIVNAVSTATVGTTSTAIQSYIQTQYNNTTTRPDYIVLIGDTSGTIAVPSYSTYMDYYYTWLAGGDSLGDVIIGRISVETTEQMINYMAKIASLEQNLDIGTAAWLDKLVLVGDTASSGISTVYTNRYVHDHSYAVNHNYTYTELYGSGPSSTSINAAINQGVAFYNYRGYIGMSGWPSYISALNNSYKLFHAVFITCNTGSFGGGTSTTESVVRQGTASTLGGSITAIGMATSSTHTPLNNCLNVGIFHGVYPLGMRDMGSAMLYGKLYLNAIYGVSNATQAYNFAGYCNLIGDPTAAVYVSVPSTFHVSGPSTIPSGASNVEFQIRNSAEQVVPGASVTLTNASGLQVMGFTDANGYVLLNISTALTGSLTLTVNKDDFKPAVSTITIVSTGGLVYSAVTVVDNGEGQSIGNGDAVANSGETIELNVGLRNTTTATQSLSAEVYTADPYVTAIDFDRIGYNDIAPNSVGYNADPIIFEIAPDCPDQHQILLTLSVESTSGLYTVYAPVVVSSGKLGIQSYTYVGSTGNTIYPGNTYPMTFNLTNSGSYDLSGINARLRSHDQFFSVTDSLGYYGAINHGSSSSNTSNTFTVYARGSSIEGMIVPLTLYLFNGDGFEQTVDISVTVGQPGLNDPLGQDRYGYFIFDNGDTGYDQCPTYSWVGVAPAEGGSGTALSLTDPGQSGDEGDQVGAVAIQTVTLPFTFKYYGINYTQVSISSNGFIAFGATQDADWRNWRMPDAGGPSPMVAAFWDDLDLVSGTSNVYYYYNSNQHYYVVEWYHMVSGYDSATQETFQAILYDPVFYPTHTSDGQIKIQYQTIANIDLGNGDQYPHGNYCTIGIEDQTETDGLEYTFNNTYPAQAAPLANGRALFITTRPILPDYPYIAIDQVNILDANSNAHLEPGETASLSIVLGNRGLVGATSVAATLSSSDPYVTITSNYSLYGNIVAQGNATPQTNYTITVSASCPADHNILFTLAVTCATGSWNYSFPLIVYVPELGFSNQVVSDATGNQNGILDPGETAIITIHLNNSGEVQSTAGTATLTCSTTGMTVNTGTDTFPILAPGGYEVLTFNVSASSSMTVGTLVQLNYSATAGTISANTTQYLEVGAPLVVVVGTGTGVQSYPLDRYYNYSSHEAIYLASEIAMGGTLKSIAFQKASGDDVSSIDAVSIYMKNTSATTLTTGDYSLTGYTLVYSGAFPNTATSGWMEVNLSPMFVYDGVSNLAILTLKGYQQWINNYPYWTYTASSTTRARENRNDSAAPTNLVGTTSLPNIRLKIFPNMTVLMPPLDLAATPSYQSVRLTWSAPASGTPTGYKIYRNSALLTSTSNLYYTDLAVTNGTSYSYYLLAVYSGGESSPTATVSATPNAVAPSNLTAGAGNTVINLSWTGATGREELGTLGTKDRTISSYRIYRNGSALTTTTGTTYQDTGLTNGVLYSYYVTTVYVNPAGESSASNTASATPTQVSYVVLGTGTSVNSGVQNSPITICNNSVHGQSVYTAAELNAAGVTGPVLITGMGFYVVTAPNTAVPNFLVRMKHTTAANMAAWETAEGLVTTYSSASYMPTAGGFDMLQFSTPFQWNGTDNILIDTAFGFVTTASNSGYLQYTSTPTAYRFAWSNAADQTDVFTGGNTASRRYNIRLALQSVSVGAMVTVNHTTIPYGNVTVNTTSSQQFTVQNTGDQTLTGTISTPSGYSVALVSREGGSAWQELQPNNADRNTLSISVTAGQTKTYNLTFAPTDVVAYNGNVVVSTNAANTPTVNIAVTGAGTVATLTDPVVGVTGVSGNFQLSWPAVPYALQYKIYSATDPIGTYTLLTTTSNLTYTDTRILGKVFYYVVAVRN